MEEAPYLPRDNVTKMSIWLDYMRDVEKRTIAFTNGVFDMFHLGHDYLLRRIKQELPSSAILLVAVNTDGSVRLNKPNRPIMPMSLRIRMLRSHRCVDAVTSFDQKTPLELITKIRPNFLIKGGDYRGKKIVGEEYVTDNGGKILFIENLDEPLARTSDIIDRIKELNSGG